MKATAQALIAREVENDKHNLHPPPQNPIQALVDYNVCWTVFKDRDDSVLLTDLESMLIRM